LEKEFALDANTVSEQHPLLKTISHGDLITNPALLSALAQQLSDRFYALPNAGRNVAQQPKDQMVPVISALLKDPEAALRTRRPHITTSSILMNPARTATAMVMHRRLGEWLYPGGHPDGQWNWLASAARECREETGVSELKALIGPSDMLPLVAPQPLAMTQHLALPKLVVHHISGDHDHLDFVYAFETSTEKLFPAPAEASACKWFEIRDIALNTHKEILLSPDSAAVILEVTARIKRNDARISV
jgi:ADP-ribose pyrophosphatase YjhB (NUDIX family)